MGPGNYMTMSSSVTALRARRAFPLLVSAEARERSIHRRIGIIWGLLVFNTATYMRGTGIIPLPSSIGKGIAQAALPVALIMVLTVNRKFVVRPNVFLGIVSLLVVEAILTSVEPQYFGTVYRTVRLAEFVAVLWLLTPWWGRRDMLLIRCHLKVLGIILGSVILGLVVAPGKALSQGRLTGALWPIWPTDVAHYAAVAGGLVIVLWLGGLIRGRPAAAGAVTAVAILVLSHTRTALIGLIAGILIAGLSLIVANSRVRKLFTAGTIVISAGVITLSSFVTTWLARGQGTQQLTELTGRTKVWGPLLAIPRDKFQEIFGSGLSNSAFNGLPIDSNWLASYQEQGLFGVIICGIILLFLFVNAYFQPRGVQRALALFLVTYCLLASFTEVGFTDASAYLLELFLTASLLVPSTANKSPI